MLKYNLSNKHFCIKFSNFISETRLSRTLSKENEEYSNVYHFSDNRFIGLFTEMGFKRKDIDYLVLLRDLHETKCPDMKRSYKRIINVYKLSNSIKIQKELKGLSEVEHTASLVLNNLDKKHKKRALEQIYINGLATLDRKNNNFLKKLLDELNNYL